MAGRYINRELSMVFLVVVTVLLVVAVGGRFLGYLQEAALGKFTTDNLVTIMSLRLPEFLQLLLPFSLFLSLLLTLGRLHADQEFAILQSGGTGPARLLRWLAIPVLAVSIVVGYFSVVLTPLNNLELAEFFVQQRLSQEFETLTPGMFHTYDQGHRVTYAEAISDDKKELGVVFMAEQRDDGVNVTVWAEKGSQFVDPVTGSRFLHLQNGKRYEGKVGDRDYRVVEFKTLSQRLEIDEAVAEKLDIEAVATLRLLENPAASAIAEFHWRIGIPLFTIIAAVMAVGLSRVKPRQGRFARLVPGLSLLVAYYLALIFNKNALVTGFWPLALGLWVVHGAFLLAGVFFIYRTMRPARG
ncbi:MAG: LPS export ABC transporter permease LptF [Gammaproteobacteria bacterium]|nr:LPS export ABC transporter permease LptF [Gammaproteobacteria bacterium]